MRFVKKNRMKLQLFCLLIRFRELIFNPNVSRDGSSFMPLVRSKTDAASEDVDLVYLWVNGSDVDFILDLKRQKLKEKRKGYVKYDTTPI